MGVGGMEFDRCLACNATGKVPCETCNATGKVPKSANKVGCPTAVLLLAVVIWWLL
jgi:hypothetical protein